METVEIQELVNENEELAKALEKANSEITRLRNNICDVSDLVEKNDIQRGNMLGQTFDYAMNQYTTGDGDNPNLPNTLSKTFDMGTKPVVIPVLDFRKLKQVKAYKDWYGYAQKLEQSVKLLRTKVKKLEDERISLTSKVTKMKTQNQSLYNLNQKLNETIKKLNEKVKENNYWKHRFEMTMPNMGPNYVSFTMMDMHKTINNQKNSVVNMHSSQYNGLDHSFNHSDPEDHPSNLDKEINQFSQNSSTKEKDSGGRDQKQHKKAKSIVSRQHVKMNKSYTAQELYEVNHSSGFSNTKSSFPKEKDEGKATKAQIKNPSDFDKYVQRKKKRGHARKKTEVGMPPNTYTPKTFDMSASPSGVKPKLNPKSSHKHTLSSSAAIQK
jgi:DNA repair exonuclease SbcCD ATPase subunit